jgi:hypothetical protein
MSISLKAWKLGWIGIVAFETFCQLEKLLRVSKSNSLLEKGKNNKT